MTRVSIIICTRDRADSLRETLRALGEVRVPPEWSVELLVVDNASKDQTPSVVEAAALPRMAVRYLHEPSGGQAVARNTGLAASIGEVIVFTDDDVRFAPDWLTQLCEPIIADRADATVGVIRLAAHLERPWLRRMHRSWLACSDPTEPEPRLIGANMAFSRRVLERVPGFDPALGPGASGFADDHFFGQRLRAEQYRILRVPAEVEHHCDPSRLLRRSLAGAARRQGASTAYLDHHWAHKPLDRPRLRLGRFRLELLLWRALHPLSLFRREGIAPEELYRLSQINYLRWRLAHRDTPPLYRVNGHG